MEEKQSVMIPYFVHESVTTQFDRANKRLWILVVVLVALLFGTNAGWIYYESQWEVTESTSVTQDLQSDGGDAIINDGVHINGESKTDGN